MYVCMYVCVSECVCVCVNRGLDLARNYVAEIKYCVIEKTCGIQGEMKTACKILAMKRQLIDPNMY